VKTAALLLLALSPVLAAPAQLVYQGRANVRDVALTFDAGADRGYAPLILRTLERNRLHATFGLTGLWAKANPDLVRRMVHDHDALINHTYDHRSFTGYSTRLAPLTASQRAWEITQTERTVWKIAHKSTKPFFRPPFGDYDTATLRLARQLGYRYAVMWTVDSLGWEHLPAASILSRCVARAQPGTIFLMHVGVQSQDGLALQPLIQQLRRKGYRFVTIAQLVAGH
jgi:peptidoglycan/xylan/chitin deacetylase (PgdA/CDA1 family)